MDSFRESGFTESKIVMVNGRAVRLVEVARWHRYLQWAVVAQAGLLVAGFGALTVDELRNRGSASAGTLSLGAGVLIVAGLLGVAGLMIRLAWVSGSEPSFIVLVTLLSVSVGVIGLFVLVRLNQRAARLLRDVGCKVGLLGVGGEEWRKLFKGTCGNCGYDVRGLGTGKCPECGTEN